MASKVNIVINGKNMASKAIKDVTKDLSDASSASNKFNDGMMKLAKFGLGAAIASVGAAMTASIASLKKSADFSDIRMQFDTLLGGYEEAEKMLDSLQVLSAKTPLQLTAVTEAATQLLAVGTDKAVISDELRMIGDLAMGDEKKFGLLTDAYSKLRAKGKVSLKELNRFTENGVPLMAALSKNLGVSNVELEKMVSSGKLKFKDVESAMKDLTNEGGMFFGMMEKKSQGVNGKLSTLRDNLSMTMVKWGAAFEPVAGSLLDNAIKKLEEFSTSKKFKDFIETTVRWATWAANEIPKVGLTISLVGAIIATTVQEAKEQLDKIGSFIIKTPVVQAVIEMAGDTWDALKKGFQDNDWSDLFGAGIDLAKTGISILAMVKLASAIGPIIWAGVSTALARSGFVSPTGVAAAGIIAAASIAIGLVEATKDGNWGDFAMKLALAVGAGFLAAGLTFNPTAGVWVASLVFNLGLPEEGDLKKWEDAANKAGSSISVRFINGINQMIWGNKFSDVYEDIVSGFSGGAGSGSGGGGAWGAGYEFGDQYKKGIEDRLVIRSPSKVMAEIGKFTVLGFTQGMDKQMNTSRPQLSVIPQEVVDTFRDVLGVHSASEEMKEIGKWTAIGFIEGFGDMAYLQKIQAIINLYNEQLALLNLPDIEEQTNKVLSSIKPIAVSPRLFDDFWTSFFSGIKESYDESGLKSMVSSIAESAQSLFSGVFTKITDNTGFFFSALINKISNTGFGRFIGKAGSFVGGVADSVGSFFSTITSKVSNIKIGGATVGDRVGGAMAAIAPLMGKFGSGLASSITSLTSFGAILDPVSAIVAGAMTILEPLINKALAPLLGILTIVGKTIGGVLAPVFELLASVTEILGRGFVWFYNKAILPVANGIIMVFNILYNAVAAVVNGIGNALRWLGVKMSMDYRSLDAGKLQAIDYAAMTASASTYTGSSSLGGSSSSVQQVTVNYYQTINGNVIGDSGMAQLGEFFVKAVEAYIGSGGTVKFVQGVA